MSWTNQQNNNGELKTIWQYKQGMDCLTILPNTTVDLILIQGDNDPTRTWQYPMDAWTHEFKSPNGKFVTVICNKWNEACVCCYENELFKQSNPNYKQSNQKLPYGLSKKALIQVYVVQENRVLWLLAGKQIQDGMDFIVSKQMNETGKFNGVVSITRLGQGLNTNYRVDVSGIRITPEISKLIQQQVISYEEAAVQVVLSHNELYEKTGINPYHYFVNKQKEGITVDISKWGALPKSNLIQEPVQQQNVQPINNQSVNSSTPENALPIQKPVIATVLSDEVKKALDFKCESGIYNGQSMQDVIIQTGKTYLAFLRQKGTDNEKNVVNILIANFQDVEKYIEESMPF